MPKLEGQTLCTEEDILVIPNCEYRGTINSDDSETKALTYMLDTAPGKIYRIIYPGGERFFIGEVEGDDPNAPPDPGISLDASAGSAAAPASVADSSMAPAAPQSSSQTEQMLAAENETLLPISGQAGVSRMPFAVAGAGLIVFMVVGGLVAIGRGRRSTS